MPWDRTWSSASSVPAPPNRFEEPAPGRPSSASIRQASLSFILTAISPYGSAAELPGGKAEPAGTHTCSSVGVLHLPLGERTPTPGQRQSSSLFLRHRLDCCDVQVVTRYRFRTYGISLFLYRFLCRQMLQPSHPFAEKSPKGRPVIQPAFGLQPAVRWPSHTGGLDFGAAGAPVLESAPLNH